MRSRTAFAWNLAPEPTVIPFRLVVSHESKFSGEDPPFAHKGQVAALHVLDRNVLATVDLGCVLGEPTAESSPTLGSSFGRLADIDKLAVEIEGVDAACLRSNTLREGEHWT